MVALMTMLDGKDEELDAVRMSTLHASKGLEYPHVFLVWSGRRHTAAQGR
jgi:ATP-dependent DNA helicase Rep